MNGRLLELAKQLIAQPSITPNDAGCIKILINQLTACGFQCELYQFGEVTNLWARVGTAAPLLVFAGHTDVVPPGPLQDWTTPPFVPSVREGHLFGRGACDMKGAVAAMVMAVQNFLQQQATLPGSIAFLITSDEEGPSLDGTKKVVELLQSRGEKIDYCLIGEPSTNQLIGDQIRVGRRGSLHGKLQLHGKQGHVAHPHLAKNPIHMSMQALYDLSQYVWDNGDNDFPATSFQITNIHGGTGATNVIPGHLEVLFNLRFSPANTVAQLQKLAHNILNKYQLTYDLEWHIGGEPFLTNQGKLITVVSDAIKKVTGLRTQLSTGGGTSDGRFIARTGAEVVELGLANATAHQVDECIKVSDLETLTMIYQQILATIF